MTTTMLEINDWFERGVKDKATHLIVVCDTFDNDDYPVYVKPGEDAHEIAKKYDGINMQEVMEVYKLSMDKSKQLSEHRAFNY